MVVSFDLQGTLLAADNSAVRPEVVQVAREFAALGAQVMILTAIHEDHLAPGIAMVIDLAAKHGLPWDRVPAVYSAVKSIEFAKFDMMRRLGIVLHFDDLSCVVDYINYGARVQRIPMLAVQV